MARTFSTTAIVLNRENIRADHSQLTLFTKNLGKIEAIAKSLRKARSKLAAHIEPITKTEIFIVRGRHFYILAGSVPVDRYAGIHSDLSKLHAAGALCQLIDACSPFEVSDTREQSLLEDSLGLIDKAALNQRQQNFLVHCFAWQLINLLGFRPDIITCIFCKDKLNGEPLLFSARHGATAHQRCLRGNGIDSLTLTLPAIKGLAYMLAAPIEDCLLLRAQNGALDEMSKVVEAIMEERFDIPKNARIWSNL